MVMSGKDPYRYFRIEARELLGQLGEGMLALEREGEGEDPAATQAAVARLLRLAHTLKGAASVVKQPGIADSAHAIEGILAPLRDSGAGRAESGQIEALLRLNDQIQQGLASLEPAMAVVPGGGGAVAAGASALAAESLKLEQLALDGLLVGVHQAHAQLLSLQQGLALARDARAALGEGSDAAEALLKQLERLLDGGLHALGRELQDVREGAEQLRLMPASQLFQSLQRTARDAGQMQGKRITFEARGGAVRLEAAVLGTVQGALMQMVRNAVAHGIESPERRGQAGKPTQGRIVLQVERRGRRVLFSCSDDGGGIDMAGLRHAAQAKGWPEAWEDGQAGEQALLQRLLRGGLSTADQVDALAGRGVGMDVVREAAERLGGHLNLHSEPGRGTRIELLVPLQLAALEVLAVEAGGELLYLPLDAVRQVLREREQVGAGLAVDGRLLAYAPLAGALSMAAAAEVGCALLLQAGGEQAALGIERLRGVASVVLRPPPALLPDNPLVAGVVLDVEQRPRLVLDPAALIAFAAQAPAQPRPHARPTPTVLVVDDSLTTRMLEQSILEAAGYTVHTAVSAEQGLEVARRQRYALFLVDVDMPGMDGFGFIEHARADPLLREVPAILVSSRSSAEDRRRGVEVGASAYIVKSEFAQNEFLRQVRQLVKAA